MLRKHAAAIARISSDETLRTLVLDYFGIPPCYHVTPALYQRGLGQADLVLCLLRVRHPRARAVVELLVGRPIKVGPPCLLSYRVNGHPSVAHPRLHADRKIIHVVPRNPRAPNTEAAARWCEFRVGRSISQLRARGVTKRDIRRAARMGWIQLEEQRA